MPPHGPGQSGSTHSHNSEYPDDAWNLYACLDPSTTALNVTIPSDAIQIFKPHALRMNPQPEIISDADAEIIVIARFESPVSIRKIQIIGGGDESNYPSLLKCYVNHENIDFSNIESLNIDQQFILPLNQDGLSELITVLRPFTNIQSIIFYFPTNHGDTNTTIIRYIGLQGEHTHYRREAVDTVYELLCTGQDIVQPEDSKLSSMTHLH